MIALRCQDDEFGHQLRQKTEMIKVIDQIVGRGRGSSSGPTIACSVIHHNDSDMTRASLLNLIFHGTGKLTKWGEGKCVHFHYFFQREWLKNKVLS